VTQPGPRLRHPFEARIAEIKRRIRPEPFDWYPWDSFATLTHLNAFLPGGIRRAVELAGDEPVADIGTGDGDIAFLLESLGGQVTAMDWPGVNANRMLGVELMKRELGSSVEIREVDLDDRFRLDGERFGLVCAFGLLYHLKNPYWFLERLGMHARSMLMSTAILPRSFLSGGKMRETVAYLSGHREFHDDPTNYWFFSEAGLLRLFDRAGWDVVTHHVTGTRKDQRAFCLAESRTAKTAQTIRLLDGWHAIENDAWRWTKREFEAVIDNAEGATRLELRFRSVRPQTLRAELNGAPLPPQSFEPGDHVYSQPVGNAGKRNRVKFILDQAEEKDGRELGVIVILPNDTIVSERCSPALTGGPNHPDRLG
jgi:hypothetical protein